MRRLNAWLIIVYTTSKFKSHNVLDQEAAAGHAGSPPPTISPTGHSSYMIAQKPASWAKFVASDNALLSALSEAS